MKDRAVKKNSIEASTADKDKDPPKDPPPTSPGDKGGVTGRRKAKTNTAAPGARA